MKYSSPFSTTRVGIVAGLFATFALVAGIVAKPDAPAPVVDNSDAVYVGEAVCIACHKTQNNQFMHTQHATAFRMNPQNEAQKRTCEACHGPGSNHLKDPISPSNRGSLVGFTREWGTPVEKQNGMCLACHQGGQAMFWNSSAHGTNQLGCSDCHNPHGSTTKSLLKADSVNELCANCHAEKRGPFLWEHAPVRDNCLNCHNAHGSNHDKLLQVARPFSCQQCHSNPAGHQSVLFNAGQAVGGGAAANARILGRSCQNCHSQIHGSNHPAGARFQR